MPRTKRPKSTVLDDHLFGFPPGLVEAAREEARRVKARLNWERDNAILLVPADRLYFRAEVADSGTPCTTVNVVKETFRSAFAAFWGRIPRADRDLLLRYWRAGAGALSLHTVPLIRVVEVTPWSPPYPRVAKLGRELNFDLAEVTDRQDHLPSEIATALAQVLLHANRRHWALALDLIEEPLTRWEKRQGKKDDDAKRDAKIDQLEQAHHRAYENEVGQIVRGWGLEPAALPPWQSSAESGE